MSVGSAIKVLCTVVCLWEVVCGWLLVLSLQYVPSKGERVLGVVTKASARQYRVDIGGSIAATLPELAFEGATKRNKQNLQVLS